MHLNISLFVIGFAAAAYALPLSTEVSNMASPAILANQAVSVAGVVLPPTNISQPGSVSWTPHPQTATRAANGSIERRAGKQPILQYTFRGSNSQIKKKLSAEAKALAEELIRRHIALDSPKPGPNDIQSTNEFSGSPGVINFFGESNYYGLGQFGASIKIVNKTRKKIEAVWNGEKESYASEAI
ncbi:hypothetical protein F5879DRAFT_521329 [Lentinula edodes]|nr:hypothetical protein F5879DRAFT_521329 [Lentinula edodes]KAJ3915856.1 hypothetical protein F5877DRAFT_81427 [Lentinula edodes]